MSDLTDAVRDAYGSGAASWSEGPARVYRPLADALVDLVPGDLAGRTVLDLGAGTGVASAALTGRGAQVIAADLAFEMLHNDRAARPPAAVVDANVLAFRDRAFDNVVAACCFNHLADPATALAEAARVVAPGGAIALSTFPTDRDHPARTVVEDVLVGGGFRRPTWYTALKEVLEHQIGTAGALRALSNRAGLTGAEVHDLGVAVPGDAPTIAAWRLGMAQYQAFLGSLTRPDLDDLRKIVAARVAELPRADVPLLVLTARVPG